MKTFYSELKDLCERYDCFAGVYVRSKDENDTEITLLFDGVLKASSIKENINNAIKLANVMEFSGVKTFINNLKCI